MKIDLRPFLLTQLGRNLKGSDTDEFSFDCPVCGDVNKYNVFYNVKKNTGKCFKCDTPFKPISLVKALTGCSLMDAVRVVKGLSAPVYLTQEALKVRVRQALEPKVDESALELPEIEFPTEFIACRGSDDWPDYIMQRVQGRKVVCDLGLGWCDTGRYKGRVIIPISQGGRLVSFVARAMYKSKRPYLYPKGCKTGWLLFNYDRASRYEHVVLVEGAFDAIRVGPRGMAVLGSSLSDRQLALLLASRAKEITLLFDSDTAGFKATRKSLDKLAPFYSNLRVVTLPKGRDPDTFEREELWDIIRSVPLLRSSNGLAARVQGLLTHS